MTQFVTVDREKGSLLLIFGRHWKFYPALFDRAAVEFPMIIRSGISGVGRSSLDLWQAVEDEKDGSLLASLAFRLVNIDPKVRGASIPIPETLRKAALLKVTPDADKFPKVAVPQSVPRDAFLC